MMAEKCKIDPKHLVDSYGCFDCFWEELTIQTLQEWAKEDELHTKSTKDLKAQNSDNIQ